MPRERTGSVRERVSYDEKGKRHVTLYARVTYTDLSGKRKTIERKADSRSHAKELNKQIIRELDEQGTRTLDAYRMTFKQLADWFESRYLIPPKYVGDRKVAGRRTYEDARLILKSLVRFFGAATVREITHADVERFKQKRLDTPVVSKNKAGEITSTRQRAIRSVNVELSLLRRILNVAVREGWLARSPFLEGDSLVSAADENKRDRILSREEEERLLAVCVGRRAHLRPIIICALDTGMRRGEMFKLRWRDVDLFSRSIHIQAFNTKTMSERNVPISHRLEKELTGISTRNRPKPTDLVFGISGTIKRSLKTACRLASVADFHLHDCRHVYATRLIQGGMPVEQVARLLGHTSITTTYRYVNKTPDVHTRAVEILDSINRVA